MITPEQFCEKMQELSKSRDVEGAHADADDMMCDILSDLGYSEGVEVFREMYKWYS